ncbi:MAG: hypothetical protein IPM92_09760 [Saprospiraceae bacterium]|nr:hypothetical protein [Saprospiraceae bacterium]
MNFFIKMVSITFFLLATSYLTKGQDHEIPGVLISNAYTDNSSPMVGCDEFNVCVFLINITYPYLTFDDAIIQMHLDLDKYEIVDAGPFTNTNQNNNNGETIFETIQELMSINDPNWQGPQRWHI